MNNMYTILDLLRWASSRFNTSQICYGHGTDNFWDESLHLVLPSLFLPINTPSEIYQARVTKKEKQHIITLINRRIHDRIPVPYLINKAWFCGLEFYIDKRAFIPRSPIGELITSNFYGILPFSPRYILDMCTGSGCIAIAMAMAYPNAEIDAIDISINALKIAEYNIKTYGLESRVLPIHSNLFCAVPKLKYDLIIVNPPYINNLDIHKLPQEFLHEPILALSANQNGLEIIHQILINIINYLNIHGVLICEVGITKSSLIKHYPYVPFYWFNLNHGGEGVFALTYKQLLSLHKNIN